MTSTTIDALDITEKWKARFRIIAEGEPFVKGVPQNYARLPFSLRFNIPGFFFSSLYYLYLRMYAKGFVIIGITWAYCTLLVIIEYMLGRELPSVIYYMPASAFCASLVATDYYKFKLHNSSMWEKLSFLSDIKYAAAFALAGFALLAIAVYTLPLPTDIPGEY